MIDLSFPPVPWNLFSRWIWYHWLRWMDQSSTDYKCKAVDVKRRTFNLSGPSAGRSSVSIHKPTLQPEIQCPRHSESWGNIWWREHKVEVLVPEVNSKSITPRPCPTISSFTAVDWIKLGSEIYYTHCVLQRYLLLLTMWYIEGVFNESNSSANEGTGTHRS
jgi:hypothetical protein